VLVERDREDYGRLKRSHGDKLFGVVPLSLVSSRIVYGVSRSVLLILRSSAESRRVGSEELRDWHSFLVSVLNGETALSGEENKRLSNVIDEYVAAISA
jgi:hypothetical protein